MRVLPVLCAALLLAAMAAGQTGTARGNYVGCSFGCGPYVPLVTTPSISLQTVSPNPVGASNATGGLTAGATNSTLSLVNGNTDATYTAPVWYSGGDMPLSWSLANAPAAEIKVGHHGASKNQAGGTWVSYSGPEVTNPVEAAAKAKGGKHAARIYTNQDINGLKPPDNTVKYGGTTKKL